VYVRLNNVTLDQSDQFPQLKKYRRLVRYNTQIIWVSIGMDVLIIVMMSLKNPLVYVQFVGPATCFFDLVVGY